MKCDYPNCDAGSAGTYCRASCVQLTKDRAAAIVPPQRDEWTDADADAARLAMELEALLLSCKDTAAVSRWWDSARDALELHRQRLARAIARAEEKP